MALIALVISGLTLPTPNWSTAEWAQVVATGAAAIAAIAACVTATMSVRQQGRAKRPNVSGAILQDMPTTALKGAFFNGGPGIAVQIMYFLVCAGHKRGGLINRGHLGVGERVEIDFGLFAGKEPSYLIWTCNDVEWNVYIWSAHWKQRRISRRRWVKRKQPTLGDSFRILYPDVPIPE